MSKFIKLSVIIPTIVFYCLMFSCTEKNSIKGLWVVDNISFYFDEKKNTPSMIKQFGEQEQQSTLSFLNDSIVNIKLNKMNGNYHYIIDKHGIITIYDNDNSLPDNILGTLSDGIITSIIKTDTGKMTVTFIKQ